MDSYSVLLRPQLSEKTMNQIYDNNTITFVVRNTADKQIIKDAFQSLYGGTVLNVNTHITPKGEKVAAIKLEEADVAEDIAVRLGVF